MKRKTVTFVLSAGLSFALSMGAVGCMITAFDLPLHSESTVILTCLAVSILCSVLLQLKYGGGVIACLLAVAAGYAWYRGTAVQQLLSLIGDISSLYHKAYNWGFLDFGISGAAADWPMAILGGLVALSGCRTVCRGKGTWLTCLLSILPLAACMVVTDTVPDTKFLFCLLSPLILLILAGSVRQNDAYQGNRLTLLAALPVILALLALFLALPQEGYVNQSQELQAKLLSYVERIPQLMENTMAEMAVNLQGGEMKNVDLRNLGARPRYTHAVMDVTADTGGILYLRGQDYDSYNGTGWTASPHRAEEFSCPGEAAGTVTVSTRNKKDILYLPYYPAEETLLTGGMVTNSEDLRSYSCDRVTLPVNWQEVLAQQEAAMPDRIELTTLELEAFGSTAERLRYVTLPGETKIRAQEILATFLSKEDSRWEQAEAIGDYVRNSAKYDLNTGRMASDAEDFALWFLTESDTGYCVHFATAAVVLLRAADIPARYVTGYMVEAEAGEKTKVTAGNAHAWAEYYVSALDTWVVLEATPADETAIEVTVTETEEATLPPAPTEENPPSTQLPVTVFTEPTLPDVTELPAFPEETEESGSFWFLIPIVLILLIPIQRHIRLTLRRKRCRSGNANMQALARWQEARLLARLLKEEAPEELFALAQKAKFSQHTLTSDELLQFDAYLNACRRQLKKQSWYWQPLYRFFWAVY